jgi:hypothetical protein
VDCIISSGAGALNIDGGRIFSVGSEGKPYNIKRFAPGSTVNKTGNWKQDVEYQGETKDGRWPSNLILLNEEAAEAIDAQSGHLESGKPCGVRKAGNRTVYQPDPTRIGTPITGYGDAGGASRFFFQVEQQIDEADPVYYTAKAGRSEREDGLDGLPKCSKVFNGKSANSAGLAPGSVEDKFTTSPSQNTHPTVKPVSLTRYLATMLLPPAEYAPRRILVPFAGVCSEGIGAMLAGWEEMTAIEREAEYAEIGDKRLQFWQQKFEGTLFLL